MRRVLLVLLAICVLAAPALAKDEDDIRAIIDKYAAAWGSLNPDNAAPLYAKDADLVFYDILPLKFTGWNAYAAGTKPHFAQFESLKITPKGDLKVTRRGDVAWTTSTFDLAVKPKDAEETMAMEVRQTLILERQGKDWKIVHEHFSTPLEMHEPEHEH
ncbi:MAG TPA: nuclear transport factor 2 family protein [Candidatus Polarisedimenticolaceae bacterium]|nr:nuclear transport factor 2 family protein [Candidatus Polarisedimenticolaceae bacterium]